MVCHNGHDSVSYISKATEISNNISAVPMNAEYLQRIKGNIKVIKEHFSSKLCGSSSLKRIGANVMAEIEELLLSQDSQIRSYTEPLLHNSALYQAKRLVQMLEERPR